MQENLNSTNILTARFEPDNSESFAFLVTLQAQGLRKKKCYIHICFADAISGKPLRIVSENEYSQFANGNSEICVSAIVKREVFSGRAMRINVPYEVFPELAPGSRITAKVSLVVGEDDAETAGESFDLMVNLGKKFTIYTLEKHIKYVKSTATEAEKIAFAKDLLKNKLDGDAFAALLDLLDDLACSENAVAQYELYHIYKDEKQGVFDAVTAVSWLKKAAENAYPPAVQEIENTQNIEEIEKTGYKNSMDLYRKAAEEGNADAQFTMCEYLSRPGEYYDQEQAAVWLKTAAENGSEAAVKRLSEYFSDAYVSEASVGEYLDIVEKAAQKNCA
ncbi:MAG: tetratricopeptide repeat protein, partial [Acetanaerobacterium sp.]